MGPALHESDDVPHARRGWFASVAVAIAVLGLFAAAARADEAPGEGPTPPRVSFVQGEVWFWRSGIDTWEAAQINTPLAPGDYLHAGTTGTFELQVGRAAFLRGAGDTQLAVDAREPAAVGFGMQTGQVTVDVRDATSGFALTLATSRGSLRITEGGSYRVYTDGNTSIFIARRGGRARIQPADGSNAIELSADTEVVLREAGVGTSPVETGSAPALDAWDQWNDERTDALLGVRGSTYVSQDVYGIDTLNQYGDWQVQGTYGPVWVPRTVGTGWVPYSSGRWLWDPYYGWTWVDTAPWGWAPFHYGRWVYLGSNWAWAPGPVIVAPVYSPALVVFFGQPGWSGGGGPFVSWVALGWGEPLLPWWGPPGFVGAPCWHGWGGPHMWPAHGHPVSYVNARVEQAVISAPRDGFRVGAGEYVRMGKIDPAHLHALPHGEIPVYAGAGREFGSRRPPSGRSPHVQAVEPSAPMTVPGAVGTEPRDHRAGQHQGSDRYPLRQTYPPPHGGPVTRPNAPGTAPHPPHGLGGSAPPGGQSHSPRGSQVPPPLPQRYLDSSGNPPAGSPVYPGTSPGGSVHSHRPAHAAPSGAGQAGNAVNAGGPPPVVQPQVVQPSLGQPMIPGPAALPNAPAAGGVPGRGGGGSPGGGFSGMPGSAGQMMPGAPSGLPAVPAAPMGRMGGQR